jgi:hypothetical protein
MKEITNSARDMEILHSLEEDWRSRVGLHRL